MEKMTKVRILLMDSSAINSPEVLDVGNYYYLLNGQNINQIAKSDVAQITYATREETHDSSQFIKEDDGSCTSS